MYNIFFEQRLMNKRLAKQLILDSYFIKTKYIQYHFSLFFISHCFIVFSREAEESREKETEAAIRLQKLIRGYRTRTQITMLKYSFLSSFIFLSSLQP